MATQGKSVVTMLLGRTCKLVALSFFLGFGLSSCSGDSGTDEAVQPAEDSNATADAAPAEDGAMQADAAAPEGGDKAVADNAEQPVVALDEGAPPPAPEEAPPAEASAATAETAPPPAEAMETATDAPSAELVDNAQHAAEAPPAAAPAPAATAAADAAIFDDRSGHVDGNSVSSPGAARYVATNNEKYQGKPRHHHHHRGHKSGGGGEGVAASGPASEYVIERGDTLGSISKKIYGSTKNWHALAEMNGIKSPYKLFPGDAMRFTASSASAQEFAKNYRTTMKTLVVKRGDSLSKLALRTYGSAGAWKRLLSFNRDKIHDPNKIEIGMTLAYMAEGASANAADSAAPAAAAPAPVAAAAPAPAVAAPVAATPADTDEKTEGEE